MTQKLILTLIAIIAVAIPVAYAQIDEVDVGFEWSWKNCVESVIATAEGSVPSLSCSWLGEVPEGAVIQPKSDGSFDIVIEESDTETEITDEAIVIKSIPEPVIKTEQQIKIEGIITARAFVEAYGVGELDVDKFCFGGVIKENTIYYPDTDTIINIKTPLDNQPLSTNQQLKYEHLMSEICKAEYTLQNKVHNAARTYPGEGEQVRFVPRENFEGLLWDDAEGLNDPTYAYAERHMTEFNFEKSTQFAETFKCSAIGKSMGFCRDPFRAGEDPEPTISNEGKTMLTKYKAYVESGVTDIPKQEPDEPFVPTTALDQYIKAYGISEEDLKEWYESRNP